MENCFYFNGVKIELTPEQIEKMRVALIGADVQGGVPLSDIPAGEAFTLGDFGMIVLEHLADGSTVVLFKDLYTDDQKFGNTNNYDGSEVDEICNKLADEIAALVGAENLVEFELDLTSDDGLDDYGSIDRKVALMTTMMYRRYVRIIDKHKIDKWWWLATAHSTPTHENVNWVKCVSPSVYGDCFFSNFGVRPFCILKSSIFVSQ